MPRHGCRLSKWKTAEQRKPRLGTYSRSTLYHNHLECKSIIKKHAVEMKDDPERLTTEFMVKITKCECTKYAKKQKRDT